MEAVAEKPRAITRDDTVKRGRFSVNLASNLGYLGLSLVVGVWYVPFLVRHLGPAAYGLIPLATTLTSAMALITVGLNPAVGRSLTIALEQGDQKQANRIFNTALWGSLALCGALLIPTGFVLVFLDSIIRVPAGLEAEARWLVATVVVAFLLNELRTPFAVSAYSRNRFDLFNLVATGEILTRVGLVVLLFYAVSASIRYVGGAILCGTLVAAAGSVWLWRRLTPSLRITRRDFNWGVLKSLATTGGWMMVNQVGWILYMGIDVLVANRLCGAELAGKYAAVLALPLLIRTLSASIGIVFQPTLTYHYARNDIDGLVNYARHGVKCLGLMLALPIALMCAFPEQLLSSWLGPDFGEWSPLLFLMAAPLCLSMAVNPLLGLHLTADRMKVPGMFTLCIGLANVGLAVLLAAGLKWGLYGIAAAGAITITLRHALFTPIYAAHILHRPRATFLWEYTPILLVTVATILLGRAVASVWEIAGWGDLIAVGLGISVLYCAGVFGLVLNKDERQTLWNALRKR